MKKVLKIVGIVILLLIIGLIIKNIITSQIMSNSSWLKEDYYEDFKSESDLEKKYAGKGEYEVSEVEYKVEDKAIDCIRVWYPTELENSNKIYPMIFEVNASNVKAKNLKSSFKRLASWGFIVVGNDDPQTGNGESVEKTLDYIFNKWNFKDNIDKDNIGIVGYSQGGAGALRVISMLDSGKYFKTIFTGSSAYSTLAKNMGWEYDMTKVNIPYFMTAGTGESDDRNITDTANKFGGVAPLSSLKENYQAMSNDVLKIRARAVGAEHQDMLNRTDGYMTAWMLYQLKNDDEAGKAFIGENADILSNSNWQDVVKNK